MAQNLFSQASRILLIDAVGEILYFPLWWYSEGLIRIFRYFVESIKNANRDLAFTLLLKNLLRPMYGVQDRSGRLISLFMRFILILSRSFIFILFVLFNIIVVLFWIFLPLMVAGGLFLNIRALWP